MLQPLLWKKINLYNKIVIKNLNREETDIKKNLQEFPSTTWKFLQEFLSKRCLTNIIHSSIKPKALQEEAIT